MEDATTPSPETTIANRDPGDETANRYRFQWTWAAVVCCMLLDDTEDLQEVFCEHHEDVLRAGRRVGSDVGKTKCSGSTVRAISRSRHGS
jgi:hypothetical protein